MGQRTRIVLGLNSGTSADGVDAAACEISGQGERMRVRLIGHVQRAYAPELRSRLLAVMAPARTTTEEICRLNTAVGDAFAATAMALLKKLGLKRVDLVGSHGQTVCHLPPRVSMTSARVPLLESTGTRKALREGSGTAGETGTLQIGDAAIIAARLGAPVVSQFRQADMAVGGQGAPLVPWTDWVLFRHARRTRVVQNIGGIANLTWLPCGTGNRPMRGKASKPRPCTADDVIAFDTGPGNMLIDALVSHFSGGRQTYDRGGTLARRGTVMDDVLAHVLAHPYLRRMPPKSCGREEFGAGYAAELLRRFGRRRRPAEDWIATATRVTAESIAAAYADLWHVHPTIESNRSPGRAGRVGARPVPRMRRDTAADALEIILCGGGAKNRTLRSMLAKAVEARLGFAPEFSTTDDYGISTQAKECVSFAMLAVARVDGVAANLPGVTGARCRTVLGAVQDAVQIRRTAAALLE